MYEAIFTICGLIGAFAIYKFYIAIIETLEEINEKY